jgi:hypothetical protein
MKELLMFLKQCGAFGEHGRQGKIYGCLGLLLVSILFVSCSNPLASGGGSPALTPGSTSAQDVTLSQLKWCGEPFIVFRDEHAQNAQGTATPASGTATTTATSNSGTPSTGTPTTLTNWSQIGPNLGFTLYLPTSLPSGSCLVSASGTLHDPVFGGNGSFTIGYLLPNHSPLSLSEVPKGANSLSFQCSPSTTTGQVGSSTSMPSPVATADKQSPYQICTGVKSSTNVVFSAQGTTASLEKFYNSLQPNVNWLPAS